MRTGKPATAGRNCRVRLLRFWEPRAVGSNPTLPAITGGSSMVEQVTYRVRFHPFVKVFAEVWKYGYFDCLLPIQVRFLVSWRTLGMVQW